MSDESPKPNPPDDKPERLKLEDVVTPVFDLAMGKRMALMRMKLLMDQKQLGERLGLHQSTISDLENGRIAIARHPFTLARFKEVFGDLTGFILYGRSPERFSSGHIVTTFWDFKLKFEAKRPTTKGENHWWYKRARARQKAAKKS